ncbi:MAG TPA: flagellin lysine-N-methylase [Polyangiales bacterium]
MSSTDPPRHTAFRYMTRFQCIGSECEATCCSGGWEIAVDRQHYDDTKKALSKTPEGRREFDDKVALVKGLTRSPKQHALLVLQNNGDCSFLDEQRLCSLQKRFGERILSHTCASYPRSVAAIGNRRELAGSASCPEVARQLLLHADALELVELPARAFSHKPGLQLASHPVHPYLRYHEEIRDLVLALLSQSEYPLPARLFMVAYFAQRTLDTLHRDVKVLDEARLLAEMERIHSPALRRALHDQFEKLPIDPATASRLVLALTSARGCVKGFDQLVLEVITSYGGTGPAMEQGRFEVPAAALVQAYLENKQAWSHSAARIDGYLTNVAKNFWVCEWYAQAPNLLVHQLKLLVRIAVTRFLLLGHPALRAAQNGTPEEQGRALDQAVVEVVHRLTRAFDHDPPFKHRLQEGLVDDKLTSLAYAACLARF